MKAQNTKQTLKKSLDAVEGKNTIQCLQSIETRHLTENITKMASHVEKKIMLLLLFLL